jgi:hypothetical protein
MTPLDPRPAITKGRSEAVEEILRLQAEEAKEEWLSCNHLTFSSAGSVCE